MSRGHYFLRERRYLCRDYLPNKQTIMKKFNLKLAATIMICGAFLFSSCIGSFGLHTKLRQWNEGISNKFVIELVFIAFNIIPVYGVCYLADALVINSIEFWSGSNPMASIGDIKTMKGTDGNYLDATRV